MNNCVFQEDLLPKVLPPLLLLEFVFGVLGNGMALWIFCFHLRPWKNSTVFLFNLALADFLLNVALPFRAIYYLKGKDWIFGDTFCRVSLFMLAMNRGGSIIFLTAVAVDRYLRVVHPHHRVNFMRMSKTIYTACALWILTISLTIHLLSKSHQIKATNSTQCESFTLGSNWVHTVYLLEVLLSLGIILFCTIRISMQLRERHLDKHMKIKTALLCLAVVVIMFVICFLPSNVTRLLIWLKRMHEVGDCDSYQALDTAFYITISLTYLNSMLDPVVYYFSSPTFKKIFKRAVRVSHQEIEESSSRGNRIVDTKTVSQL
ncbi:hydroxycarboxylic acid receptor 2-like [Megalops cyprinoides]|uniref:hydroxycarboxylic acid receptor 2-like n=1 Tax=Megalops cyprinoides TaxID=118141 RepID=UPI00186436FF|nr:hydroxycarboxylic acid receptor 2-like [Megalops cyprinoides]